MNQSPSRRLRIAIGSVCVAAGAVFVAANGPALRSLAAAGGAVSPPAVLAGVAISLLAILNRGGLNRATHHVAGLQPAPMSMIRPAAVGFAANKILRSGGASGTAVFVRHGEARRYPGGTVVAACALAALASLAALAFLMLGAVGLLALRGALTGWWTAAAVGFLLYTAALTAATFVAVRRRDLLQRGWDRVACLAARLRRRPPPTTSTAIDDFAAALASARHQPRWTRRALVHAIGGKALGAAMLLCAVHSVGIALSPADVVIVYATALGASMASLIPAGVGVVEASIGALLVSHGAAIGVAVIAVALFRLFDLWIPVVAGALASRAPRVASANPTLTSTAVGPMAQLAPALQP